MLHISAFQILTITIEVSICMLLVWYICADTYTRTLFTFTPAICSHLHTPRGTRLAPSFFSPINEAGLPFWCYLYQTIDLSLKHVEMELKLELNLTLLYACYPLHYYNLVAGTVEKARWESRFSSRNDDCEMGYLRFCSCSSNYTSSDETWWNDDPMKYPIITPDTATRISHRSVTFLAKFQLFHQEI